MKIVASHLTLEQRQVIYPMRMNGKALQEIADVIAKNKSTVSRELRREKPPWQLWNSMTALERAKWMNDQAVELRTDWKKGPRTDLEKWDVQGKVHEAIVEGKRSAEQTAMILKQSDGVKFSGSTIRRHAEADKGLKKHFPQKGKKHSVLTFSQRPCFSLSFPR